MPPGGREGSRAESRDGAVDQGLGFLTTVIRCQAHGKAQHGSESGRQERKNQQNAAHLHSSDRLRWHGGQSGGKYSNMVFLGRQPGLRELVPSDDSGIRSAGSPASGMDLLESRDWGLCLTLVAIGHSLSDRLSQ